MRRTCRTAAVVLVATALSSGSALADEPGSSSPAPEATPAPSASSPPRTYAGDPVPSASSALPARTHLAPGEKRQAQDYDGREEVTTTAEDALWIPRVLLFPIWVVTEYVVRAPLSALGRAAEDYDLVALLAAESKIGVIPSAFVDFGFRPSVGLYFFWNDFLADGNDLRATVGFGGLSFWRAGVADRIPLVTPIGLERSRSYIQLEADFLTRADLLFWGIGPSSPDENQSVYGIFTFGAGIRAHVEPWRGRIFEAWVTGRGTTTNAGACRDQVSNVEGGTITRICSPPTIRRQILDGVYPAPPSYGRPYTTEKSGLRFVLDSREPRPAPGTGIALDASVEHVTDLDAPLLQSWFNWGGVLAGFLDVTGNQRVLSLTLAARFQDAITDATRIPFTELVGAKHIEDVPDLDLLRGFQPGRLLGHSAVVATLEYRWPIWAFIDGTLQAAVGNAFDGTHLDDFAFERLRFSFVGGLRSPNHRDHSFNFLVGFGTNTFEDGGEPSAFRLLIGSTTGF